MTRISDEVDGWWIAQQLRDKVAEEIARSRGCSMGVGYWQAHQERFRADADRILAIPEISEALKTEAEIHEAVRGGGHYIRANPHRMAEINAALKLVPVKPLNLGPQLSHMDTRLNEFDHDEWREVARVLRPDWTDEDFDREWAEFQEMKRGRKMQ